MSSLTKYILFFAMPVYHQISYSFPSWNLRKGQVVHSLLAQEITTFTKQQVTAPLPTHRFISTPEQKRKVCESQHESCHVTRTSNFTFNEFSTDLKSILGAQKSSHVITKKIPQRTNTNWGKRLRISLGNLCYSPGKSDAILLAGIKKTQNPRLHHQWILREVTCILILCRCTYNKNLKNSAMTI